MTGFIHLRVHTAYSLLEGAIKVKDLVALTAKNKMPAVGIADTNNMFGALEFATTCVKQGIQPIIGMQVGLSLPHFKDSHGPLPSIVLIAQNEHGYKNLMHLISHAYEDLPNRGMPYVTLEDLESNNEGVLLLSGGAKGPLGALFLNGKKADARTLFQKLKTLFPNRLYVEIQRHGLEEEDKTEPFFLRKRLSTVFLLWRRMIVSLRHLACMKPMTLCCVLQKALMLLNRIGVVKHLITTLNLKKR